MRVLVDVRDENIILARQIEEEYRKGDTFSYTRASSCPIALRLKELFPDTRPMVYGTDVVIINGGFRRAFLPMDAQEFVKNADSYKDRVDPITFFLDFEEYPEYAK